MFRFKKIDLYINFKAFYAVFNDIFHLHFHLVDAVFVETFC